MAENEQVSKGSWVQRALGAYPRVLDTIIAVSDLALALVQTLIIAVGLPAILVGAAIVEQHGVHDGLRWFLADEGMAVWAAWVLVLLNVSLEFQITHVEHKAHFAQRETADWSARLWLREALYRIGWGKRWRAREKSPAARFFSIQKWITATILLLALMGRMQVMIDHVSGVPLTDGLTQLVEQSSLRDAATWLGGVVFTLAALLSVQGLTRYIALKVIDIRETLKKRQQTEKALATKAAKRAPGAAVEIADAYTITRVRDNSIVGIKHDGGKIECPVCHKVISKQAWVDHPCRMVDHKVYKGDSQLTAGLTDEYGAVKESTEIVQ